MKTYEFTISADAVDAAVTVWLLIAFAILAGGAFNGFMYEWNRRRILRELGTTDAEAATREWLASIQKSEPVEVKCAPTPEAAVEAVERQAVGLRCIEGGRK